MEDTLLCAAEAASQGSNAVFGPLTAAPAYVGAC